MSRERLEEIKKHRNEADNSTDEYEFEKINFYNLHVDWLIEQAERVQELEGTVRHAMKAIDNTEAVRVKLINAEQQNKRYRKALEFYADEETYETKFATDTDEIYDPFTLIELDEGKKARKALEGEE